MIKGFARSYDGVGAKANQGFYYLNPFLSTSRRVFGELNSDQAEPRGPGRRLRLAHLDARREAPRDIESLVGEPERDAGHDRRRSRPSLASAVGQLPDFMRQFNTTAVNLRAALDDVDPLIDATRPVARKLQPFAKRLRGFARDAVPTVKGLDGDRQGARARPTT